MLGETRGWVFVIHIGNIQNKMEVNQGLELAWWAHFRGWSGLVSVRWGSEGFKN